MYAYAVDRRFSDGESVKDWPELKRIRAAGQLTWWEEGGKTMVALKALMPKPLALHCFAEPRQTADGLTYYPPKETPTIGEVHHSLDTLPYIIEIDLACGSPLEIVPSVMSPRRVLFGIDGGAEASDYLSEYARLSDELHQVALRVADLRSAIEAKSSDAKARGQLTQELEEVLAIDERLTPKVALMAIQSAHYVTNEVLNDMGIITEQDLVPIVTAAWGVDPKKLSELASEDDG